MDNENEKYDRVIVELYTRINKLEEEIKRLTEFLNGEDVKRKKATKDLNIKCGCAPLAKPDISLTEQIRRYIEQQKALARKENQEELVLNCNDLQKVFHISNRPRSVCRAMYDCMKKDDVVLQAPPSGYSTTVTIKYIVK